MIKTSPAPHNSIAAIEHHGEIASNEIRSSVAKLEPKGLRTYTPSLAVIVRSEGCYHFTPEGRKLADFTSGVLVANLGHNPPGWWRRVETYLGLRDDSLGNAGLAIDRDQAPVVPLTAYNAVTE